MRRYFVRIRRTKQQNSELRNILTSTPFRRFSTSIEPKHDRGHNSPNECYVCLVIEGTIKQNYVDPQRSGSWWTLSKKVISLSKKQADQTASWFNVDHERSPIKITLENGTSFTIVDTNIRFIHGESKFVRRSEDSIVQNKGKEIWVWRFEASLWKKWSVQKVQEFRVRRKGIFIWIILSAWATSIFFKQHTKCYFV